jgi:hypothetical protein
VEKDLVAVSLAVVVIVMRQAILGALLRAQALIARLKFGDSIFSCFL